METFNNVINSGQLVLVDFFATWCQPCKAMHPILEQVKSVLGDRIRIIKVDVDKYGVTASQYRIQSVPTLMLFQNGEVLWRTSGAVSYTHLLIVQQVHRVFVEVQVHHTALVIDRTGGSIIYRLTHVVNVDVVTEQMCIRDSRKEIGRTFLNGGLQIRRNA